MINKRKSKLRPNDVKRYRELLAGEWSDDTLPAVLKLISGQFKEFAQFSHKDFPDIGELRALIRKLFPLIDPIHRSPRIALQLEKPWPERKTNSQRRLAKLSAQTSKVLSSQWQEVRTIGDEEFLKDVQSMLFLCALDFLLPALDVEGMSEERALVLASLSIHIALWTSDVAHHQFLLSRLYDYWGMHQEAEDAAVRAFQLTPPHEHDFLSKAQAAWMAMVDRGDFRKARDFLLDVYRRAPLEALSELREMLDETPASDRQKRHKQPA